MTTVHDVMGYRIVLNKTKVKRISVESAVNAGFLHETKETAGVNHLLEHVLTESWKKCGTSCSEFWNNRGVRMNASTDETIMMYYVKGLEEDLTEMVNYVAAITSHPIMRKSDVKKEKQAVIDELLTYGSDPASKLDHELNHLFFKNGLEFKDDWKLQIQNLKRLTLADLQKTYRAEFTPSNVVFVVSGDFSKNAVLNLFRKSLTPSKKGVRLEADGFSLAHEIRFVHDSMATTLVVLAVPSAVYSDSLLVQLASKILEMHLFTQLRTKRQLVYGVHVNTATTTCGTHLQFKIYVRPNNVVECLRVLVSEVNKCMESFNPNLLLAAKKQFRQDFSVDVPDAEFYALQYVTSPDFIVSHEALLHAYEKSTVNDVVDTIRQLIVWKHAACVYQGQRNLNLTWDKIGL